jgi:hypothetical protein
MKFSTSLLCTGLILTGGFVFAESSVLPIEKAVALAREQLQIRGLEKTIFIQAAVLESQSLLGGTRVWKISWSDTVPASSGRLEIGVEVNMKGEVVRLVMRPGELLKH